MLKGFVSKDYVVLVIVASLIVVLLLGVGFTSRPSDWAGWMQAIGLIVGLMAAVAVPAIQRKQEAPLRASSRVTAKWATPGACNTCAVN